MTIAKLIEQLSKFDGNAEVNINREFEIEVVTIGFGSTVSVESSEVKRAFDSLDDTIDALQIEVATLQQEVEELQEEIESLEEE